MAEDLDDEHPDGSRTPFPPECALSHADCIIHFDLDQFYAQVEMVLDPSLCEKPIGIQQKYLVVTCNYLARKMGVTKLQGLEEAKKRCPNLVIINGEDLTHYREASDKIHALIRSFTPSVQKLGFDETFMDATALVDARLAAMSPADTTTFAGNIYTNQGGLLVESQTGTVINLSNENGKTDAAQVGCNCGCAQRLAVASQLAQEVRASVFKELGYTCCAGVSVNKMLAKLAGELHKPNQQTTLLPQFADGLISGLPLRKLPGCGHSSSKLVEERLGVTTVQQLRGTPWVRLVAELKPKLATLLYQLCRGVDVSKVVPSGLAKTMGDEDSFRAGSITTRQQAEQTLERLAGPLLGRLAARLQDHREEPRTLKLMVRRRELGRESRQCPFPLGCLAGLWHRTDSQPVVPPGAAQELVAVVVGLFDRMVPSEGAYRDINLLHIGAADFRPAGKAGAQAGIARFLSAGQAPTPCPPAPRAGPSHADPVCAGSASASTSRAQAPPTPCDQPELAMCAACGLWVHGDDAAEHQQYHEIHAKVPPKLPSDAPACLAPRIAEHSSPAGLDGTRACDIDANVLRELPPHIRWEVMGAYGIAPTKKARRSGSGGSGGDGKDIRMFFQ